MTITVTFIIGSMLLLFQPIITTGLPIRSESPEKTGQEMAEPTWDPAAVTDATIRSWVQSLADPGDHRETIQRLRELGNRATPHLIAAISDPVFQKELTKDAILGQDGLERVLGILRDSAPPEAVPSLIPFIDHKDTRRINTAALLLGCIADERALPALTKALTHDDDYVRGYALMGLAEAKEKGRGTVNFWKGIYPHLIPLVEREDKSINDEAPKLVVAIEPVDGPALLMDRFCTKANRRLPYTLQALRISSAQVPIALMDRMYGDTASDCGTYPWDYALADLLRLMASRLHPRAKDLAQGYLNHANETIREGAADALVTLSGMADPATVAFDIEAEKGYSALTEAQRTVFCIRCLVDEVNNGGLDQYLFNSSGDQAKEAIASLERIGAPGLSRHLRTALESAFGPAGPSEDRERRQRQLDRMKERQETAIESFNERLYKSPEPIGTLMMKYAMAHADDFKAKPAGPVPAPVPAKNPATTRARP